jgi:hypothetical protein
LLSSLAAAGIFLLILSLILGMCIFPLLLPNIPEDAAEAEIKEELRPTDSLPSGRQSLSDRGKRRRSSTGRGTEEIPGVKGVSTIL